MKLEINKNHKKANLKNLKFKNRLTATFLSTVAAITIFSGCSKQNIFNQNDNINPTEIVEVTEDYNIFEYNKDEDTIIKSKMQKISHNNQVDIPDMFKNVLLNFKSNEENIITIEDLEKITELNLSTVTAQSPEDLIWLNYCTNLQSLQLLIFDDSVLEYISTFPNLENLALYNCGSTDATIDYDNYKFLFSPNLNCLVIDDFNVQKDLIESLPNIKTLDISSNTDMVLINYNLDYQRLTNLDTLIISNPYTIAVHMNKNDIETLTQNNVKIIDKSYENQVPLLLEINEKIDKIVEELNINNNSTEEEKIDKIIMYAINNLTYDSKISKDLSEGNNISSNLFYENGFLYGALELDTQICGNYSALIGALCERVGINEINQMSSVHSWNLVYVDGNNYYVDSTLIDINIQDEQDINEMKQNEWYMQDPNQKTDYTHKPFNLSDIIKIEEIKTEPDINVNQTNDISNKVYKLTINEKEIIIGSGALIGILAGLGFAHEKKKKRINQDLNKEDENVMKM